MYVCMLCNPGGRGVGCGGGESHIISGRRCVLYLRGLKKWSWYLLGHSTPKDPQQEFLREPVGVLSQNNI